MWFVQSAVGGIVALLALGLSLVAIALPDERRRSLLTTAVRALALAYALAALALACWNWWPSKDWMHQLWASTHPQFVLFALSGAFLVAGDRGRERSGASPWRSVWPLAASMLALALLPALLIQWAPDPDAAPRNVGRPIARTLELLLFGLGGPLPEVLVPETAAGHARGMGFLPREVTVPLGALATFAVLWILVCAIRLAGAWLRPARLRHACYLLAPWVALALSIRPLPLGLGESSVWAADPLLLRGFGPLLVLAAAASFAIALPAHVPRPRASEEPQAGSGPA